MKDIDTKVVYAWEICTLISKQCQILLYDLSFVNEEQFVNHPDLSRTVKFGLELVLFRLYDSHNTLFKKDFSPPTQFFKLNGHIWEVAEKASNVIEECFKCFIGMSSLKEVERSLEYLSFEVYTLKLLWDTYKGKNPNLKKPFK